MKPTEEKIQGNASDLPVYLFKQGNNCEAYRYFGEIGRASCRERV